MLIIEHRINAIKELGSVPAGHGVEVDVRRNSGTGRLYLGHDAGGGEDLEEYLKNFRHAFIVFNIKEAGTETGCIELAEANGIPKDKYFLLDVEFPYLYRASRQEGVREIAARFSEIEPIEMALAQKEFVDWVWIDTNTKLPLDESAAQKLAGFKTCLVGPDRWGRPEDIIPYLREVKKLGLPLTAIMVGGEYAKLCEGFNG
jgi:hypothetical protein